MSEKEKEITTISEEMFAKDISGDLFKVTKTGNTAMVTIEDDIYVGLAKKVGIDKKTLHTIEKFNNAYLNTISAAAAKESNTIMKKDNDIDKVVVTTPFTTSKAGKATVMVNRSQTFTSPATKEEITKSTIKLSIKVPSLKLGDKRRKELEAGLTQALLN